MKCHEFFLAHCKILYSSLVNFKRSIHVNLRHSSWPDAASSPLPISLRLRSAGHGKQKQVIAWAAHHRRCRELAPCGGASSSRASLQNGGRLRNTSNSRASLQDRERGVSLHDSHTSARKAQTCSAWFHCAVTVS